MKKLDLYTGLGGFVVAGDRVGISTIFTSEIDTFNCKLIEQKLELENAGDVKNVCVSEQSHPYSDLIEREDFVPCEKYGFSSLCIEDFYEGVIEFPDIITGGFPCQNVSQANLAGSNAGIEGESSSLVEEQLRIISALEPKYCVFENAKNLVNRGLDRILAQLESLGYEAQWGTVSATAFGYPHYRHRTFLVAYLPSTNVGKLGIDIFNSMKRYTVKHGEFKLPLPHEDDLWIKDFATVKLPRSIKYRTKRINSLGKAIIPDIAEAIFNVLLDAENEAISKLKLITLDDAYKKSEITNLNNSNSKNKYGFIKMADAGCLKGHYLYESEFRDTLLNPTNNEFKGLYSTLISKDGNNNFTCKSRLTRPGKLGGLVGSIMSLGVDEGGLDPNFCEWIMGYDLDYTLLPLS